MIKTAKLLALCVSLMLLAGSKMTQAVNEGGAIVSADNLMGSFVSKFTRYVKGQRFTGLPVSTWRETAWKGERVHQQIVLSSTKKQKGLVYEVSDLVSARGRIGADHIQLRFVGYGKGDPEARDCDGYPERKWPGLEQAVYVTDPLFTKPVNRLSASDTLKLWLTIDVPISATAGNYTGTLSVAGESGKPVVLAIDLSVTEHRLPAVRDWTFHLDLWQFPVSVLDRYNATKRNKHFYIKAWSQQHLEMLEPTYRLLADMGQKVITTSIKERALGAPSMVQWILDVDGATWKYDFTDFDRYVRTLMEWGIDRQISAFSPVGWYKDKIYFWNARTGKEMVLEVPLGSKAYNALWRHFLIAFKAHLEEKGWFEKTVLYLDEVPESELSSVIALVKYSSPDWRLGLSYGHAVKPEILAEFHDVSGILGIASQAAKKPWQIKTFYTSCTQTLPNNYLTPENNPAEMTWMPWHAMAEGFDGYLRWAFDHWLLPDPFDMRDGLFTAGDFSLVYRDGNKLPINVVSSIRAELLREGIQDFEKLTIIRDAIIRCDDNRLLDEFNKNMSVFTVESGVNGNAEEHVNHAQRWLKEISRKDFFVCHR